MLLIILLETNIIIGVNNQFSSDSNDLDSEDDIIDFDSDSSDLYIPSNMAISDSSSAADFDMTSNLLEEGSLIILLI